MTDGCKEPNTGEGRSSCSEVREDSSGTEEKSESKEDVGKVFLTILKYLGNTCQVTL